MRHDSEKMRTYRCESRDKEGRSILGKGWGRYDSMGHEGCCKDTGILCFATLCMRACVLWSMVHDLQFPITAGLLIWWRWSNGCEMSGEEITSSLRSRPFGRRRISCHGLGRLRLCFINGQLMGRMRVRTGMRQSTRYALTHQGCKGRLGDVHRIPTPDDSCREITDARCASQLEDKRLTSNAKAFQ